MLSYSVHRPNVPQPDESPYGSPQLRLGHVTKNTAKCSSSFQAKMATKMRWEYCRIRIHILAGDEEESQSAFGIRVQLPAI